MYGTKYTQSQCYLIGTTKYIWLFVTLRPCNWIASDQQIIIVDDLWLIGVPPKIAVLYQSQCSDTEK